MSHHSNSSQALGLHIVRHVLTRHSGGLEMLFSNQKRHVLSIPTTNDRGKPINIAFLVDYLVKNVMKDPRKELFVLNNQVYACLFPSHLPSTQGGSSSRPVVSQGLRPARTSE